MSASLLLCAAGACALAAIAVERNERRHPSFYLLKPLTTLLILAAAALAPAGGDYQRWVLVALALSLAGDVCLMFSGDAWFMGGLSSFLLAHVAFIAAFLQGVQPVTFPGWLGAVALYAGALLWLLLPRAGRLKAPLVAYCLVLGAMVCAAAARQQALPGRPALLALGGALLFMLSDSALGLRQFVRPYRHAQPLILATYWAAIALIAASV